MARLIFRLAMTIACFALGYYLVMLYERHHTWSGDALVRRMAAQRKDVIVDEPKQDKAAGVIFEDIAARSDLDFSFYDGATGKYYLIETLGGGVAALDYDADGFQDLFFANGSDLTANRADRSPVSALFRNESAKFSNVTVDAGLDVVLYGQGISAADFDNDGFDDILVTGFGRLVLYHNHGDGTFGDVAAMAGLTFEKWGTSSASADLDQDGDLDLFVCTYAEMSIENALLCWAGDRRTHCLPSRYRAQSDLLYENQGDGRFLEIGGAAGIVDPRGRGLGVVIAQLAGDARPDIFVANDTTENYLFVNQGGLQFEDRALTLGAALTGEGLTMSGMGVACADYDNNGLLDLLVTNFYQERSVLYQNMGEPGFRDSANTAGVGLPSRNRLGFGTVFLDADLDGNCDLFVANGHVSDQSHLGGPYKMRQQFFHNRGGGTFRDTSDAAGPYFERSFLGRGVASLDVNNDGLPDVAVSHIRDPAALLLNQTPEHGHWLGLRFVGRDSNRNALNTRVEVVIQGTRRVVESVAGGSYLSSSDKRLLIGLGSTATIDALVVTWPSGLEQKLESLSADRYHLIVEPATKTPLDQGTP